MGKSEPFTCKLPMVISRIMLPDDANIAGNVHGGTLLRMIAQAGYVLSTRHCNSAPDSDPSNPLMAVLARVENTDFHQPVFIGEVAEVYGEVVFTSGKSIEVVSEVWAENLLTGVKRCTNRAQFWYVAIQSGIEQNATALTPVDVPQFKSSGDVSDSVDKYVARKWSKMSEIETAHVHLPISETSEVLYSSQHSQTSLIQMVLPHHCLSSGHMQGGSLMRLMDNCAGVTAARHCKTNVVTASLGAIDFRLPILKGELVTVRGRLIFTSSKTMLVKVTVEAEGVLPQSYRMTTEAYFTFVSLDGCGKTLTVPQLTLLTEKDKELYEVGRQKYNEQKLKREREGKH